MNRLRIVIVSVTALLITSAVVVASRNSRQPAPQPEVPVAVPIAKVRVKAVEREAEASGHEAIEATAAVAVVCGADKATAGRYEARNDALRSIARRRDLAKEDVNTMGPDPIVLQECLPCEPPVGTIGYRTDIVPPSKPHYPHTGTHTHLYVVNQSPIVRGCKCFWHPVTSIDGDVPPR